MPKSNGLDSSTRLHLGGYLVYNLVDFRARFFGPGAIEISATASCFQEATSGLLAVTDSSEQLAKIEEMDRLLGTLDTLLMRMRPHRKKDFLLPLFQNSNLFLGLGDYKIREFLQLLCDENTPSWKITKYFVHDCRHYFSEIGGFLFEFADRISREQKPIAMSAIESEMKRLSAFSEIIRSMFEIEYFFDQFKDASKALLRSYLGTEFHYKAAELMVDIIRRQIESQGISKKMRDEELMQRFMRLRNNPLLQSEPHVTPLLNFLREIQSWETAEEILLNDSVVLSLKRRIEEGGIAQAL